MSAALFELPGLPDLAEEPEAEGIQNANRAGSDNYLRHWATCQTSVADRLRALLGGQR